MRPDPSCYEQPPARRSIAALINWRSVADIVASLSTIVLCATVIGVMLLYRSNFGEARGRPAAERNRMIAEALPDQPVDLRQAGLIGASDAPLVVVLFTDFQCPFCSAFSNVTLPKIRRDYIDTGKVRLAIRHLPLSRIHPFARLAATASVCANAQGRFWPTHDLLFSPKTTFDQTLLTQVATNMSLDRRQFDRCAGEVGPKQVEADIAQAKALNISSTPTFLFGYPETNDSVRISKRQSGALSAQQFQRILDELLRGIKR